MNVWRNKSIVNSGVSTTTFYELFGYQNSDIIPGTVTFTLNKEVYAIDENYSWMDYKTGLLTLEWAEPPGEHTIHVRYAYDIPEDGSLPKIKSCVYPTIIIENNDDLIDRVTWYDLPHSCGLPDEKKDNERWKPDNESHRHVFTNDESVKTDVPIGDESKSMIDKIDDFLTTKSNEQAKCKHYLNSNTKYEETKKTDEFKEDKKFTSGKFLASKELDHIKNNAGVHSLWDFNLAFGDTLKGKFESLYTKLYELTEIITIKGAKGEFWIVTSPEIASLFEFSIWFARSEDNIGAYRGTINSKWRLYVDNNIDSKTLVIGCNDTMQDMSHYARLTIHNFVI